jgi:hypothetical protein
LQPGKDSPSRHEALTTFTTVVCDQPHARDWSL